MKHGGIILLLGIFISSVGFAQGFTNYGAKIIIEESAFVHVGNYTAEESSSIDLNGILELEGNWTNNNNQNPIINTEPEPDGWIYFAPETSATISGNNKTSFENIKIHNQVIIENDDNEVKGVLSLEGSLRLNSHRILLLNPSPAALEYHSGYILSETLPAEGLGELVWQTAEETGTFSIPFGSGLSDNADIAIELNIQQAGISESGLFSFASYPTNAENQPLPPDINELSPVKPLATIDRFWEINPTYSTSPDIAIYLQYNSQSLSLSENTSIREENLKLTGHKVSGQSWEIIGEESNTSGIVGASGIQGSQSFDWFTLSSPLDLIIPNGISPNGDGYNDTWIIDGCSGCNVEIYNRWGNKIYESDNYDNSWDGDNLPSGAYYYLITMPDGQTMNGDVNILR